MKRSSSRPPRRRLLGLAAFALAACGAGDDPPRPRHVLLLTLDTTRADHLGCYGNREVKTPAIDALAAEGVRFAECSSAAATTLASHTSLMTGAYPHRHGVGRNGFIVNEENRMLAEALADAGFWCAAFLGSSALAAETGFGQGFHHYDDAFDVPIAAGGADQNQRSAASVTDALLAHVDEVLARPGAAGESLFLFAQYFDPHAPYAPPAAEVERYGAEFAVGDFDQIEEAVRQQQRRVLPEPLGQQRVIQEGLPEALVRGASGAPTKIGRSLARLYAGEVSSMDAAIGSLLSGLAARGLLDDTLIVVTADHGETFWEHGNAWNHGLWVSQTDVHVPLILRFPDGRGAGRVVPLPVSGVDLAPTLLAALGLESRAPGAVTGGPAPSDAALSDAALSDAALSDAALGRSLLPLVDGAEMDLRAIFSEATQPGPVLEQGALAWRNARKPRAVRLGPWKLVEAPYLGVSQLFHLGRDPKETQDLLVQRTLPADAATARDELQLALVTWLAAARPLASRFDPTQALALKALGYFEAGEPSSLPREQEGR